MEEATPDEEARFLGDNVPAVPRTLYKVVGRRQYAKQIAAIRATATCQVGGSRAMRRDLSTRMTGRRTSSSAQGKDDLVALGWLTCVGIVDEG